jgi:hypothetical protein
MVCRIFSPCIGMKTEGKVVSCLVWKPLKKSGPGPTNCPSVHQPPPDFLGPGNYFFYSFVVMSSTTFSRTDFTTVVGIILWKTILVAYHKIRKNIPRTISNKMECFRIKQTINLSFVQHTS